MFLIIIFTGFSYIELKPKESTLTAVKRQLPKLRKAKKRFFPLAIKGSRLEDNTKYRLQFCAEYEEPSSCAEIDVQTYGTPLPGAITINGFVSLFSKTGFLNADFVF